MVAKENLKPHFFRPSKSAKVSKMNCLPVRASLLQMRIPVCGIPYETKCRKQLQQTKRLYPEPIRVPMPSSKASILAEEFPQRRHRMPEGVHDAAGLRGAVGCPVGTSVRTFSLQLPDLLSEIWQKELIRELSSPQAISFHFLGAHSGEVLVSALSAFETSVCW